MIDVSSKEAQNVFFIKGLYHYDEFVATNNWALRRSIDNKGVLIMYRGQVSLLAMDVVNPDDGEFVMPLLEALVRASLCVGNAVVRTILRPYFPDGRNQIEAYLQRRATGAEPMARSLAGIPPRPTREYDPSTAVSTKKELEQECAEQGNTKKLRIKPPPDSKDTPAVAQSHGSLAGGSQSSTRRSPPPPPPHPARRPPSGFEQPGNMIPSLFSQLLTEQAEGGRLICEAQEIREGAATPIPEVAAAEKAATPIPEAPKEAPKARGLSYPSGPPVSLSPPSPESLIPESSKPVLLGPYAPKEAPKARGLSYPSGSPQSPPLQSEPPEESPKAPGSQDPSGPPRSSSPPKPESSKSEPLTPILEDAEDSKDAGIHREDDVDWIEEPPKDEQEVFSQLCTMLRNFYFRRQHKLLASYTPDKVALWKRVRELEDGFVAKAKEIKEESLIEFGKSHWCSSQPHLKNPYKRGVHHDRFWARSQDQEEIVQSEAFKIKDRKMKELYCSLYESLTEAFMTPELQGRVPE